MRPTRSRVTDDADRLTSGRVGESSILAAPRRLMAVLTAGLMALGLTALAPAAVAAGCPDASNTDCPSPPSESQFVQLTDDTMTYFSPGPIRTELLALVHRAQDALHPPAPIHPPSPIRSYHLLGGYLNQVQALAGTANGATDGGTVLVVHAVSTLRSQIAAAFPALQFQPGPFVRPGS